MGIRLDASRTSLLEEEARATFRRFSANPPAFRNRNRVSYPVVKSHQYIKVSRAR
jgi:hypothetical protein